VNRREALEAFVGLAVASSTKSPHDRSRWVESAAASDEMIRVPTEGWITDVDGIEVGHYTEDRRPTGCTVILCRDGATGGADVPGGNPGSRLTDMLQPIRNADESVKVEAVVLTGGSDYGLASASGVERYLRDRYFEAHKSESQPKPHVPIVPAAVIYDLYANQDWRITPTEESGYKACENAAKGKIAEGCVGAGAGAAVGHWGGRPTKSGLGTASVSLGKTGVVVGAISAVNAVGDVYDPRTGKLVAGSRSVDGRGFSPVVDRLRAGHGVILPAPGTHTTISCIATNANFDSAAMAKIAQMASAAHARVLNPSWAPGDGDTVFALSTGTLKASVEHGAIGAIAAEVLTEAILRAVVNATGIPGMPSYRDLVQHPPS
jgi:L-aminopeptidase/D-esterase-like protein